MNQPLQRTVSRRRFLTIAGLSVGGASLACCGLGYAASQSEPKSNPVNVETPSFTFGKDTAVKNRILITYATGTGSTVGVASTIGETLEARGFSVDVKPVKENPSIDGYQAVIIGSAVNGWQWLPEAVAFVKDHQQALSQVPVAMFCVHALNLGDDERSRKNRLAYLNSVRSLVKPAYEAFFAGMGMKPEETNGIVRWLARTFFSAGEGDCRDWGKIRGWAQELSF